MKNKIVLTRKLTENLVDLTVNNKNIIPKIKYKNTYFNTDLTLNFKVISAENKDNILFNTIRYINIDQIKQNCFRFSNNIPTSSIYLKFDNYIINNNKILVQSLTQLKIPVSAYANINNKDYYLNTNICNIQNYQIYADFNTNKIIIPKNFNFLYQLSSQLNLEINKYPNDLISTQISLNNEKLQNLNIINCISGILTNLQEQTLTGKLQYKIYNFQLNKFYTVNSIDKEIYIVSVNHQNSLWLSKKEFQQLYNKNRLDIKHINFIGNQQLTLNIIPSIIKNYTFNNKNKTYQETTNFNKINKLTLNEQIYCENILINQFDTQAYIYSKPFIIKNNFIFLDKSQHSVSLDKIVNYPEDNGLINNIKVNQQNNISEVKFSPQITSSLIQFEKISIDNQTKCIDEIILTSKFFNIKNKKDYTTIQLNGNIYELSGIYTTDNIKLQIDNDNQQYYAVELSSFMKPKGTYTYYINNIKTNNINLLNTIYTTFKTNISYINDDNYQQLLSSTIYNVTCYGNLIDLSKKQYTILTLSGNNILDARRLKNNNNYILDPSQPINIFVQKNFKCIRSNIHQLKYLDFNYENNFIYSKDITYDNVLQIKKQLDKKQYYILFKDEENNQIKYTVGFKNLFKLPGEKYFQVNYNNTIYNINNIESFYNNKLLLQDNNLLILDKTNFINFKKIQLNITAEQLFNIELSCNIRYINQFTDKLIDNLSSISNDYEYNISGKYFEYINDKISTNINTYGKYNSYINIIPKTLTNNNIIQNFNKKFLNLIIKPNNFNFNLDSISGVYYSNILYQYYANIKIDAFYGNVEEYIVDLNKLFKYKQNLELQSINQENLYINNNNLIIKSSIFNELPKTIYINTKNNIIAILDII